jgi:hypothetical protein
MTVGDQQSVLPPSAPAEMISPSEGDVDQPSSSGVSQDSPTRSRYWDEDLPAKRRRRPNPRYSNFCSGDIRVKLRNIDRAALMALDWTRNEMHPVSTNHSQMLAHLQLATDPVKQEIDGEIHPCLLSSKASQSDNPTYEEAMNGPHREGFLQAMAIELKTLTDMACWEVVPRVPGSNVLPSTWAFKLKRYPDGSLSKYKARFCAGGHRQIEGVDFFETFAPIVNWTTVRLLLILSQALNLATKQVDYTVAFVHAPIHDIVYVEMPRGFSEAGKVLKLRRSLYGLKQSLRNFFRYLKSNLEQCGLRNPSPDTDPCLFVSDKVICVFYVDDTLLWSPRIEWINDASSQLERTGIWK